jgi:hypothetical protein
MRRATTLVAAMFLVAACREDPIILATLEPTDRPPSDVRCVRDECPRGTYCEKLACDAPAGTCVPFATVCPSNEEPVCGCDGVTYFNDCLRRASGAGMAHPGECGREARPCQSAEECPSGAACSLLTGLDEGDCRELRGRCWVVPVECPPPSALDRWQPCLPPPPSPEPPPALPCVDTCTAVRSGAPHTRAFRCE